MSNLALNARAVYNTGPFKNLGPLPPRADKETTYTVIWTLTNSYNDVNDIEVKSTLPGYVRFIQFSPQSEKVSFDENSREIVWRIGELKAGNSSKKEVAFQIGFTPGLGQVGSTVDLVDDTSVTAKDKYTEAELSLGVKSLNTEIVSDPQYNFGFGKVSQ